MKKNNNPFFAYKSKNPSQRIALTGIFIVLVFFFQYIERYLSFGSTYLKFNFSLIFILPIFYFSGPLFGFISLLLRFFLGPIFGIFGYTWIGILSHLILFFSSSITIILLYIFSLVFSGVESNSLRYIFTVVPVVFFTSIILCILNGLFFTPLFFNALSFISDPSIEKAKLFYESNNYIQIAHFGILNYWKGIMAVYISGNLLKFSSIFLVNFPLSKIIKRHIMH